MRSCGCGCLWMDGGPSVGWWLDGGCTCVTCCIMLLGLVEEVEEEEEEEGIFSFLASR